MRSGFAVTFPQIILTGHRHGVKGFFLPRPPPSHMQTYLNRDLFFRFLFLAQPNAFTAHVTATEEHGDTEKLSA